MAHQLRLLNRSAGREDPAGLDARALAEPAEPIEAPRQWQLDDQTRAIGRRGVAEARRVLAEALERHRHNSAA
jgi:hypothetical protein